jgi:hypothetical protein
LIKSHAIWLGVRGMRAAHDVNAARCLRLLMKD